MNPKEYYENLKYRFRVDASEKAELLYEIMLDHIGQENAISVEILSAKLYGDGSITHTRMTRKLLERMRNFGIPIMSSTIVKGRWLASNSAEVKTAVDEMRLYADSIMETARALEKTADNFCGEKPKWLQAVIL